MASSATTIPESLQRRARRSHKKSKNGCRTCRIRKCDERRPLCRNCERHFIGLTECDFDEVQAPAQVDVLESSQVQHEQTSAQPDESSPKYGRAAEPLKLTIRVRQPPASHLLDPFQAYPATSIPPAQVDILMRHYLSDFIYRMFPFYVFPSLSEPWWQFLRDDQLSFHVMLLLSRFDRQRLAGETESSEQSSSPYSLRDLMHLCLSLLSSRVGDPSTATTDSIIVSVSHIAALEHARQNIRPLRTHLRGLNQMIQSRGLANFRAQNPLVASIVSWTIMITNERRSTESSTGILPLPLQPRDVLLLQHDLPAPESQTSDASAWDMRVAGIDEQTIAMLTATQLITEILNTMTATTRTSVGEDEQQSRSRHLKTLNAICIITAELLEQTTQSPSSIPSPLSQSFRLTASLQLLAPLSGYFPDPTLLLHSTIHDLKSSLTAIFDHHDSDSFGLLLWLLSMGAVSAHSMAAERNWFVGRMVVAANELEIRGYNEFREYLARFAPRDEYCDVAFGELWGEVEGRAEFGF